MRVTVWVVLMIAVAGLAYIRLAPDDVARWHQPVSGSEDSDGANSALRVVLAGEDALARADAYMRGLARTEVLAGHPEDGRITYVTRSRMIGFPDYTTLETEQGMLKAYARARYGKSDLGVNGKRLEGLLGALQ